MIINLKKNYYQKYMANYTSLTLGELLSSENETIKRNAVSILKVLQKKEIRCWGCGVLQDYEGYCSCCKQDKRNIA